MLDYFINNELYMLAIAIPLIVVPTMFAMWATTDTSKDDTPKKGEY